MHIGVLTLDDPEVAKAVDSIRNFEINRAQNNSKKSRISLNLGWGLWVIPSRFELLPLERHIIGDMDFDVGEFYVGDGHGCILHALYYTRLQ